MLFQQRVAAKYQVETPKIKVEKEDDSITFTIGDDAGVLVLEEQHVSDDFPFGSYEKEKFYEKITDHDRVISIQLLEVKPDSRGQGYARMLMEKAIAYIKKAFPNTPVYINASPMGFAIGLQELVEFYKSYGFKVLKTYTKYKNALLWRDKI